MTTSSRDPPAITPDVRTANHRKGNNNTNDKNSSTTVAATSDSSKKVVSFGFFHASKSPRIESNAKRHAATAAKDAIQVITKEEATQQYKLYRSSPASFPSYDRIELIKLPREYLPASLSTHHGSAATNTNFFWPALIYNNLVEVVRDLSPNATPLLKAQLIVEYKKHPTRRVARLIGWNNGIDSGDDDSDAADRKCGRTEDEEDIVLFAESQLELVRLSSSNTTTEMVDGETKNFCESLMEMEKMYCHLLQLAKEERKSRDDKKKKTMNAMKRFANRFGYALDMALNCLSRDVGSEPLLPRIYEQKHQEDEYYQEVMEHEEKKTNHVVCKTPNAIMATNDGDDTIEKHSPAEDSMFSTAAVADGGDYYHNGVSEQQKPMQASTSSTGTKRTTTTKSKDQQHRSDESNSGGDEGKAITKKTGRPATTSTATVARVVAAVGRSKPLKSSTIIDKACVEEKNVAAPTTTKSIKDKAPEKDTAKEIIPWKDVWAAMKRCGWTWKGGSGLMTDYYYIKPKCKVQGGVPGVDYFVSVGDTMEFARRTYGWDENVISSSCVREQFFSLIEEHAKYAGEVVPPLTAEMTLSPNGAWRDAWEVMLRSGWTWRTGSGLMMDYYYIKPGCKVGGGEEGQDYFVRVEDVQQFAKRNYGWRGNSGGVDHDTEDYGATKARTRRLSSSDGSGENTVEIPVGKRPKLEVKKPTAKESVVVDAAMKSMRPAKVKTEPKELTEEDDTEDDDDEIRSTFSQSGLQSKKLFSDECADEIVPPLAFVMLGDETWSEAWKKMRESGWTWKVGSGLMTDYFYIKPGCKVKGGVVGRDYFVLAEDVQRFAIRNYGWKGGKSTDDNDRRRISSAVESKSSMKKRKHDDLEDSLSNSRQYLPLPTNKAVPPMPALDPNEKKAQWQELQRNGWKAVSAGRYNKLHDWYYVRPHCDPGDGDSKLGVDFFLCEEDAIEAAKKISDVVSARSLKKRSREDEEEEEEEEENEGQHQQVVEETASPIRPARKGTSAGPLSTPQDCRTRPQDPAVPLLSSPESCSSSSRYDLYEWHNLWPTLERSGWRCIKAGKYNPLHNYYYVRPKRDPGNEDSVFGKHYFDSQDDVISYVKGGDNERGPRGGKRNTSRKSMGVMLGEFEEEADD